jgi:hypothetical protein
MGERQYGWMDVRKPMGLAISEQVGHILRDTIFTDGLVFNHENVLISRRKPSF